MADIVLSYARENVDRVQPLARALEAHDWTVFWDAAIPPASQYRQVILREIDAARCVVVLWSHESVEAEWVLDEADRAKQRDIVLSVLIDDVTPPFGFGQRQAASLVGWKGEPQAPGVENLIRAVEALIGRIKLWPIDLNLITGDRQTYPELGPTINMECLLLNEARLPIELQRLEAVVAQSGRPVYHLVWHLFYSAVGLEHIKTERERITINPKSVWKKGVQFRESQADFSNIWNAGRYELQLLGWANRRPPEPPNVKSRFQADVDSRTELEMRRWRNASVQDWDNLQASNRALGFPAEITQVRVGL